MNCTSVCGPMSISLTDFGSGVYTVHCGLSYVCDDQVGDQPCLFSNALRIYEKNGLSWNLISTEWENDGEFASYAPNCGSQGNHTFSFSENFTPCTHYKLVVNSYACSLDDAKNGASSCSGEEYTFTAAPCSGSINNN